MFWHCCLWPYVGYLPGILIQPIFLFIFFLLYAAQLVISEHPSASKKSSTVLFMCSLPVLTARQVPQTQSLFLLSSVQWSLQTQWHHPGTPPASALVPVHLELFWMSCTPQKWDHHLFLESQETSYSNPTFHLTEDTLWPEKLWSKSINSGIKIKA